MRRGAVFFDRDGVLVEDAGILTCSRDIRILDGVPLALEQLKGKGYRLVIVSNQAAVARGLLSEEKVLDLQNQIGRLLIEAGAPPIDGFYFCPHHPSATIAAYRTACECRKPRPGLLLRASHEHGIALQESFMVGDRITDVIAGARAGCRTVLVETGAHEQPPIETVEAIDLAIAPDYRCRSLAEAAAWILQYR